MGNKFLFINGKQIPVSDDQLDGLRDTYAKKQQSKTPEIKKYTMGQVVIYKTPTGDRVGKVHNFDRTGKYQLARVERVNSQGQYQFSVKDYDTVSEEEIIRKLLG